MNNVAEKAPLEHKWLSANKPVGGIKMGTRPWHTGHSCVELALVAL
ncbi:MAG: hypothetical protein JKY56_14225 [Kofleriaceae bacterium]|nr:hypothetical protein [Kofleriaceae bacterium]